jgi:hypothetical protein
MQARQITQTELVEALRRVRQRGGLLPRRPLARAQPRPQSPAHR